MDYDARAQQKLLSLMENKSCTLLAIETSCDETAAAVVKDGKTVLSNAVYSQVELHKKFGGVVPELASRSHVEKLTPTVNLALSEARLGFCDLDAVAVTARPGLVGALLTGVNYAKGLAYGLMLPLVGVDHILGHIAANYITSPELEPPFVCLAVSGGHSHLYLVESYTKLTLLGRTRDDAAGEAFDKVARVLGLGYPGGPALEALAAKGGEAGIVFPSQFNEGPGLDFSFSGLKTAVINYLLNAKQKGETPANEDIALAFEKNITSVLIHKTIAAAKLTASKKIALAGGVCANKRLRLGMAQAASEAGLNFFCPSFDLSTDNAAMIGAAGYFCLMDGRRDGLDLNASSK
ncbi:MAG: tRNA N6-adenosine threonylcarbamoyltransferase [Firmicutes bacterium ADurb.Bin356]|nr:MAG: tRNA N6-adenosine threonylcarbamoyltransferase [Firmicutes bacterium ADurb.Bin356]